MAYDALSRSYMEAKFAQLAMDLGVYRFQGSRDTFEAEMKQAGLGTRTRNALLNSEQPYFHNVASVLRTQRAELMGVEGLGKKALAQIDELAKSSSLFDLRDSQEITSADLWRSARSALEQAREQAEQYGHTSVANELLLHLDLMDKRKPRTC